MRAFIAVDLPEEIWDYVKQTQARLNVPGLRLAGHSHITLKFLGNITPQQADTVVAALHEATGPAFTASTTQIGFFPDARHPRVIWLGASGFEQLHQAIDEKLSREFPEDRKFVAHVTLARVKSFSENLRLSIKAKQRSFQVTDFALKESTLGLSGPAYRDIQRFPLESLR